MSAVRAPRLCPKCGGGYDPPPRPTTFWGHIHQLFTDYSGPSWTPFHGGRYDAELDALLFRCALCGYDLALEPADMGEGERDG